MRREEVGERCVRAKRASPYILTLRTLFTVDLLSSSILPTSKVFSALTTALLVLQPGSSFPTVLAPLRRAERVAKSRRC